MIRTVPIFTGALILCLFSTIQKILAGYPIVVQTYIVPVLIGGTLGLIIGVRRMKILKGEDKIKRLNLALRVIRNINKLIVKEKDRPRLLQGVCDNLIENRDYYNAWIALMDKSGSVVATAEAGLGNEFLPLVELFKRNELTQCARKALEQSGVVLTEDPFSTCIDCPLSGKYAGRGAMTVRLAYNGRIYGILSASIPKYLVIDEEEQDLFQEMAGDIAFALYNIELEKAQELAEKALRESEENFRSLAENAFDGILIATNHVGHVYANKQASKITGYSIPELFKIPIRELVLPDEYGKIEGKRQRGLEGKSFLCQYETVIIRKDGSNVPAELSVAETIWAEMPATMTFIRDITEAKKLKNLLIIQDKMTSLGRVAAGIAHEIRNPLSGINIYLKALDRIVKKGEDLEQVEEIFERIQSASSKIESVIRRVMDFSRPSELKFVLIDINQPITEAINLSSVTLRKIGIKIEKKLAEDLPKCYADSHLIEEVILNLITNAAEAMKNMEGIKRIEVASSFENNHIFVRIADAGPGVPLDQRDKIFEPFYTTKNGGTGIGLSLNHRIIADHGGTLSVSTSQWGGAEFVIELQSKEE